MGGGDGFAAGLFYGLLPAEPEQAVKLGWAHGALLTTFPGDTTMAPRSGAGVREGRLGADSALRLHGSANTSMRPPPLALGARLQHPLVRRPLFGVRSLVHWRSGNHDTLRPAICYVAATLNGFIGSFLFHSSFPVSLSTTGRCCRACR